jgi:prolyl oligopeptidase
LRKLPAREEFKKRLTRLNDVEQFGLPFHEGAHYFYSHNTGLQDQGVLFMTEGPGGAPVVALDPNTLSKDGSLVVSGYVLGPGGTRLAYGVTVGGSDWTEWRVRDLASGKDLPDVIRHTKYYAPVFAPDGKGLYYSGFPAPAAGQELTTKDVGDAVYYHSFGTEQSADRKIFERADHPDWQFEPHLTPGTRWLVIAAGEGEVGDKGKENLYAVDLSAAAPAPIALAEGFDAGYLFVGFYEGLIYFQTTLDAPRGRVIAIAPESPERSKWKEIIPQGADAMDASDRSVSLVDRQLVVRQMHDAHSKATIYGLDGQVRHEVRLPGLGTAFGFGGNPYDKETFFEYMDFITPETVYRLDMDTGEASVYRAPKVAFTAGDFEVKQVFYPGKDGTKIPMFIATKKGLKLDGTNPTLLYGYGGFAIPCTPWFNPAQIAWMELGGVYALANIRGGGEYGEEWHQQAIRTHKQVSFDDFIAAAEWLIAEKYTSTPRLAINGASNGGLLVGASLTQRPDLFGAVLVQVGALDMLRFDRFGQGEGWIGDFGSPSDPEDFKALYSYSPYHHIRPGVHYPATLLVTGDHDTRVMPAHSFKFVAALQLAQAGPAPILLKVEASSGHGGGATTTQYIDQNAELYAFLADALGMTVP